MSFLPTLSPPSTAPATAARAALGPQATVQAVLRPAEAVSGHSGAVAEITAAKSQIPQVQAVQAVTKASTARPGHDGRAAQDAQAAEDALADAREAEEARRRADEALREALARIPVPVQAIPKLSGDLETIRSIEKGPATEAEPAQEDAA